MNKEYRH